MAERFSREYAVAVDWQPFLLRPEAPDEGWPLPERIKARMNRPDDSLHLRAKELGLPLVERDWIPSSRRALAVNEHVRTLGLDVLDRFHSAVNARYWGKGEDLSKWETLEAAAKDIGIDGAPLREAVEGGGLLQRMADGIAAAHRLGIHSVPTYVFFDTSPVEISPPGGGRDKSLGGLFDGEKPVGAIQGAQEYSVFQRAAKQLGL